MWHLFRFFLNVFGGPNSEVVNSSETNEFQFMPQAWHRGHVFETNDNKLKNMSG